MHEDTLRQFLLPALTFITLVPLQSVAQSLPEDLQGTWDVSRMACETDGTTVTQIEITADSINSFGGDALVREVTQTGLVTFVAADYLQTEGVPEPAERNRTYYRLTLNQSRDQLTYVWKDVDEVDLVRCSASSTMDRPETSGDPVLPIPTGYYVSEGTSCDAPANASWRSYDGRGIFGASSEGCEMQILDAEGDLYVARQRCTTTYDASQTINRDIIRIIADQTFSLMEDGETTAQTFNWCSARIRP